MCCNSASSARTNMPAGSGRISTFTVRSRAVGSMRRATSPITAARSTTSPCERCPRDRRRKCWVIPRQRRSCSRAMVALSRTHAESVSFRMPSTHASTVPSGVFNSCENPDASVPTDASRCDSARWASAARRSEMSRHTSTTCCRRPEESRMGEACTSSQTARPSGVRRSQMRTWRAPDARHASVGQSETVQPPGVNSRHWQPNTCSRECCARSRNESLAAITWRCPSSTTMPSSMLLMTVSSRSRWLRTSPTSPVTESAMALNSRASQEMVSLPAAGTRCARSPEAIRWAAVSKRCSRRSTARRMTTPMAPTSSRVMAAAPATSQRRSRAMASLSRSVR